MKIRAATVAASSTTATSRTSSWTWPGVNEGLALLLLHPDRFREGGPDVGHQHDLGPVAPGGVEVVARRGRRHDDRGGDAELPGGVGDPLGVIAAADGHHAALPLVGAE